MLSVSKSQHSIWKIELTQVTVNSVDVVSSFDVISVIGHGKTVLITLILASNKAVPLQIVSKV